MIPTSGRQRQVGLLEFKASLVYRTHSRTAIATLEDSGSNKKKINKKERQAG